MSVEQDVFDSIKIIQDHVIALLNKPIPAQNLVTLTGLSDIDTRLGLITAGEFRTGNMVPPGAGFSGVRTMYPGASYGGEIWNIMGISNDVIQFGLRASDGAALAGAGAVVINANGITIISGVDIGPPDTTKISFLDNEDETTKAVAFYGKTENIISTLNIATAVIDVNEDRDYSQGKLLIDVLGPVDESVNIEIISSAAVSSYQVNLTDGTTTNLIQYDLVETIFNELGADLDFRIESDTLDHAFFLEGSSGTIYINETANTQMAGPGITINQTGNDDQALAFKDSTDVDHGITTQVETDTYGSIGKIAATTGGMYVEGFSEAVTAFFVDAQGTGEDTATSTAATGQISFGSWKKTGTTVTTLGSTANLLVAKNGSITAMILKGDGTLYIDGSYLGYSDSRLKTNIKPIKYGLKEILALEPKQFTRYSGSIENGKVRKRKGSQRHEIGLVAQDVENVIPEIVEAGRKDSLYGLDKSGLVPVLVRAVQELNEKIEKLEAQFA